MNTLLLNEIPAGAIVKVTLHNGKMFEGVNGTHGDDQAAGLLRLVRDLADGEQLVFFTTADQISCFAMIISQ